VLHSTPEALVQPGKVDAWLCGSGISEKKYENISTWLRHRWFTLMKAQSVPTILDAGALDWAGRLSQPTLITPHAGELSRLLKKREMSASPEAIESDPSKWAVKASQKLGVVVLLKGATTYVASEKYLIELPKATAWLATAGTGDVLAGIIGALVATNYISILNDPEQLAKVAATGAFIHNLAAVAASKDAPISATSVIEFIPEVIRKIIK
jgi:NAD(P)H-hydrate repair Nnr-like enzyme with NAD(P)H-hydrate dehydratase domain